MIIDYASIEHGNDDRPLSSPHVSGAQLPSTNRIHPCGKLQPTTVRKGFPYPNNPDFPYQWDYMSHLAEFAYFVLDRLCVRRDPLIQRAPLHLLEHWNAKSRVFREVSGGGRVDLQIFDRPSAR
jgi:hypothetical protein